MIKIIIIGPNGNMGRGMIQSGCNNPAIHITGGVAPKGRDYIGVDLGYLAGVGKSLGVKAVDEIEEIIEACDVVLDCSLPEVSLSVLKSCLKHKKPFVTGTTGFSNEEKEVIKKSGEIIPVLHASNTSKVVHQLFSIVESTAKKLGVKADIYITEMHNNSKKDAPSGTALEMGNIITRELNSALKQKQNSETEDSKENTINNPVNFSSVRSGEIPATHQIIFGFENERLELTHHAYNMKAFADGMIEAGIYLHDKEKGCYNLKQVFNLDE